jgi:type IV pilus assembly protein PilB
MHTVYDPQKLKMALGELGIISPEKLESTFAKSLEKKIAFDEVLLRDDLISDVDLGRTISETIGVPFVKLGEKGANQSLLTILPETYSRRHHAVVFNDSPDSISVAASNPLDRKLIESIAKKTQKKVSPFFATTRDIELSLAAYNRNLNEITKTILSGAATGDEGPIERLVYKLVEYGYRNRASDIHIEPERFENVVRFRIDGVLHEELRLPIGIHQQIISRIKYLAKLRTDEHMSAQDGKIQMMFDDERVDIRISIVPVIHGEVCTMRLLASRYNQYGLTDLGMNDDDLKKVERAFKKPFGMVLSTGPTGSGKSTTMYSILKILNTKERNIATIEDPVEYDIEGLNQIQVNTETNLTFAEGLRSILRQDPNIIYVGEIRDEETAGIAVNSALTGHLVLSTLHTNDAATTLPRFLEMKIEPYIIASTVNVIVAQRLVRRICLRCMVSYEMSVADISQVLPKEMVLKHSQGKDKLRLYKGSGCSVCHGSGYQGRICIFEVLEVTPAIQQMVTSKATANELKSKAIEEGMHTMIEDGFTKALLGLTSFDEILAATKI